ncbi:uncharacterized protein SPAPADRAFT_48111 [Spathaspora passalidarum NRRL Y-27907]|uniref:Uncharacterized protein n=1 Tax=Spathaspora passalidarum (strain NRRL Y-27907 / 11-Y1) TaxID=619300 RepID=G3AFS1_SPAPN|nr:uncharacterized protein SPAPADRAFT_48111 [Spathaspora passalidarum NRRL Y-27907]EGW35060.1 hypothetical protein SPAPADRAFT_48111 [Spathaspora passalidarum NRRL Y-27907]
MSVEVSTNKIQQTRVMSPQTDSDNTTGRKAGHSTQHHHHSQMYKRSASTSNLPLNNPSMSSLSKKPQYSGRLKSHNRSLSHNKLFSTSSGASGSGASQGMRPNLNRSKSSDVLTRNRQALSLKRNSRSFTKVAGLQPLTKTTSNQSLKSNKSNTSLKGYNAAISGIAPPQIGLKSSTKRERAILRLNDNDADYEDVEDAETYRNTTPPIPERFNSDESIPAASDHSEQNIPSLFEQINRMVPPSAVPTPTVEKENKLEQQEYSHPKLKENRTEEEEEEEEEERQDSSNSDKLEVVVEGNTIDSSLSKSNMGSNRSSTDNDYSPPNANLYGGSLLLSQSTGLLRKIDPMSSNMMNQKNSFRDQSLPFNNSISGISFKANPMTNLAQPVINNQNVIQNNSYQPNQTIFNNLQRTNNQLITNTRKQPQTEPPPPQQQQQQQQQRQQQQQQHEELINSISNGANNFTDFLRTNSSSSTDGGAHGHNAETRTQQRLWLQRESSMMDVTANMDSSRLPNFSNLSLNNLMFAHNYNNQSHLNVRDLQHQQQQQQQQQQIQQQHNMPQPLTPVTSTTNGGGGSSAYAAAAVGEGLTNIGTINGILTQVQGHSSIQSRTEFERLNREYLNVRRHLNPVGESLNRLDKHIQGELKVSKHSRQGPQQNPDKEQPNSNSFKEFCPSFQEKESEVLSTVGRLWQDAIFTSLGSSSPPGTRANNTLHPQVQSQRPTNARIVSYNQNQQHAPQAGTRSAPPQTRSGKISN